MGKISKLDLTPTLQTEVNKIEKIGDTSALQTTNKENLVQAINELFQSANNGKTLIANVVGSPVLATQTFQQQATNIQSLKTTLAVNLINKGVSSSGSSTLNTLIDKVNNINTGKRSDSGTVDSIPVDAENPSVPGGTIQCLQASTSFLPSSIIIRAQGGFSYAVIYCAPFYGPTKKIFSRNSTSTDFLSFEYVNSSGFRLMVKNGYGDSSSTYEWIAIE